jgi:hypothetical protein
MYLNMPYFLEVTDLGTSVGLRSRVNSIRGIFLLYWKLISMNFMILSDFRLYESIRFRVYLV